MPRLPEREQHTQPAYEQLQNAEESEDAEGVSRGTVPAGRANGRSGVLGSQNVMIQGDETSVDAKSPEDDLSTLMLAPADRTLRQTKPTKLLHGGLCFTPDGGTLIHGGSEDTELSLWDLRTAKRTVGLERTGGIAPAAAAAVPGHRHDDQGHHQHNPLARYLGVHGRVDRTDMGVQRRVRCLDAHQRCILRRGFNAICPRSAHLMVRNAGRL